MLATLLLRDAARINHCVSTLGKWRGHKQTGEEEKKRKIRDGASKKETTNIIVEIPALTKQGGETHKKLAQESAGTTLT